MSLRMAVVVAGSLIGAVSTCSTFVAIWYYKRKIIKRIQELLQWLHQKIKEFTQEVQDVFTAVVVAARRFALVAYECISRLPSSLSPEQRRTLAAEALGVFRAGLDGARTHTRNRIHSRYPNPGSPERRVLDALMSQLDLFENEYEDNANHRE